MKGNGYDDGDLFGWQPTGPHSRADQIIARFEKFFKDNPIIWTLFVEITFERIRQGFKHYSVSEIIERIRWHTPNLETESDKPLKISNDFRAYYARLFAVAYPEYEDFFLLRKRRSEDQPPLKHEPEPDFTPPDGEDGLNDRLRRLL